MSADEVMRDVSFLRNPCNDPHLIVCVVVRVYIFILKLIVRDTGSPSTNHGHGFLQRLPGCVTELLSKGANEKTASLFTQCTSVSHICSIIMELGCWATGMCFCE